MTQTMRVARLSVLSVSVTLLLAGCAAAPKPPPDRATLSVLVRAEPKAGWHDPDAQRSSYEVGTVGGGRAFEQVNYAALDDIVVWVEPRGATARDTESTTVMIDIGRPGTAIHACGARDQWVVENTAPEPLPVYALYESGHVHDIGTVAPGAGATVVSEEPGLVHIMCDIRPDPLAQIYVAPVPTGADGRVRVVRSGTKVQFRGLPPGPARVACWHPRLPGSAEDVLLVAGATTNATLVVGVNLLPKLP